MVRVTTSGLEQRGPRAADQQPSLALRVVDRSEWHRHERSPGATAFSGWDWLSWVAPLLGCRFVPLALHDGCTSVGLAPMLLRRRLVVGTANVVPFPVGPVVPPEHLSETARLLRRWAARQRVLSFDLAVHPTGDPVPGSFTAAGLTEGTDEACLVDLQGRCLDDVWRALGGDARTAVRRSGRRGVTVRASTPDELVELLPRIHEEALGRDAGYPRRIGAALAEDEAPFPVRCATAVLEGRPVGVSVAVGGANAAGWLGGVLREHQHTSANAALVWDAIRWAHAEGCCWLDMLGAPDPGIAAYKRKFRPRVLRHPVGSWRAPGFETARRAQQVLLATRSR